MRLITNHTEADHSQNLIRLLQSPDEVRIAIAFLKNSGLGLLIDSIRRLTGDNKIIKIIAGQNFALTEPKCLHTLRELFEGQPNAELFIANAEKAKEIFHPKLYLFRHLDKGTILVGSSNVTQGGLSTNTECSVCVESHVDGDIWKDAIQFFDHLTSLQVSRPATLLAIKQYESFYESQKRHNAKSRATPDRTRGQMEFNYENLLKHFRSFDSKTRAADFAEKQDHYAEALRVLDSIANNPNLTSVSFSPLLDRLVGTSEIKSLWHSGSLFRLRKKVYSHYKEFGELVRFIRTNKDQSPEIVYDGAIKLVSKIEGAAANYVAEIMITYNPDSFANINSNPITVLRDAGDVNLKSHSSSFSGKDYGEYCEIVREVSQQLGLRNMLEADSFFNEIYWKIYQPKKVKKT